MTPVLDTIHKSPILPDAGVSVIVPWHGLDGLPRFRDAWETQLARVGRPVEFHAVDEPTLGGALRAGLALATHPLILIIVPDFGYRPGDLRALFEAVNEADMALGVRPGYTRLPLHDRLSRIGRWFSRVVFGIDFGDQHAWYGWPAWRRHLALRIRFGLRAQDPTCGLRLIRRAILDRCPIQSNGGFALIEMIAKVNFTGGMIVEVPLGKASDLPTAPASLDEPTDERAVFRHPTFIDRRQPVAETKKPEENVSSGP